MASAKVLMRYLLTAFLLLGPAASCTAAPATQPTTARVIDYGIVRLVGPLERHVDPATATGFTSTAPGRSVFEKQTTETPAVQGTTFGFRYRIEGIQPGHPLIVEEIIRHPPITRPDGTAFSEERTRAQVSPPDGVFDQKFLYFLREPYEVVPGDWSLAVAVDGTVVIDQHFTLTESKQ